MLGDKKGQGLSVNAIILIILGVVVLVMLIFGFTTGWDFLKKELIPDNNVDDVAKACNTLCISDDDFDYCISKRDLSDGKDKYSDTCYAFVNNDTYKTIGYKKKGTCSIDCGSCSDSNGEWKAVGVCVEDQVLDRYFSDTESNLNKVCCIKPTQ